MKIEEERKKNVRLEMGIEKLEKRKIKKEEE